MDIWLVFSFIFFFFIFYFLVIYFLFFFYFQFQVAPGFESLIKSTRFESLLTENPTDFGQNQILNVEDFSGIAQFRCSCDNICSGSPCSIFFIYYLFFMVFKLFSSPRTNSYSSHHPTPRPLRNLSLWPLSTSLHPPPPRRSM